MKRGLIGSGKGLSTIISTLIIILLVFVAVGILWVVVRNLVTGGSDSLNLNARCVEVSVTPTKVVSQGGSTYDVSLVRSSSGSDFDIGGIKLIFSGVNETENYIEDISGNMAPLGVQTISIQVDGIVPDEVESVVYFLDESGNQHYCQGGETFKF